MAVVSGQSEGTVELTPSGIGVYFQSKPKRLYRVYPFPSENEDTETWQEVPSVTTVLGVLDKSGPLIWWAQRCAIEGVQELKKRRLLWPEGCEVDPWWLRPSQEIVDLLVEQKLSTNHVRDRAGDRGQAVHDALEGWARHGHMPDPSIYPEEQEGYVRGLVAFLKDVPTAEPEGAEVLVASAEHGYAGRYDLRLRTNAEHEVVVRRTATRVRKRKMAAGRLLVDLKSSKSIYASHALQLAAYEQASIESGYEPTDGRGVLLVTPEGHYEFRRTKASADDFHAVLNVYNRMQGKKEWL